jgi:hypothetical protein
MRCCAVEGWVTNDPGELRKKKKYKNKNLKNKKVRVFY